MSDSLRHGVAQTEQAANSANPAEVREGNPLLHHKEVCRV
jgi:hypothetical protein